MVKIGDTYHTNLSGDAIVIGIENQRNITIKFIDTGNIKNVSAHNLIKGKAKDNEGLLLKANRYGVGYIGIGPYSCKNHRRFYDMWYNMLQRCYSEQMHKREPSYFGCECCKEWHCFQNFAKWCDMMNPDKTFCLDKDILCKRNKIYSPETCCFVPAAINKLFVKQQFQRGKYPIGVCAERDGNGYVASCVNPFTKKAERFSGFATPEDAFAQYKVFKESIIQKMADKYRDVISDTVYTAMLNYQVEITD